MSQGTTTLQKRPIDDPQTWDQTVKELPQSHVLQSWAWGDFKERHGWRAQRWLWESDGEPRAGATVLSRSIRGLPLRVMYVPKGPALDPTDGALLTQVLSDLEHLARSQRALFIKIDPDIRADTETGEAAVGLLEERGWQFSPEQIQFRNTLCIDLAPDLDEIMSDMKSKWRYNIRLAKRRGVTVREGDVEDLALLYDMYAETSQRGDFVIRPEAYYQDAWGNFIEAGLAQPLIAEFEEEPVAMVIIYRFGPRAWYMYGASRTTHREHMPNHRLQWEAIRWAKAQGCEVYDMWGAPDELDESDPMWGVYRFKRGFGAEFVPHIGAYDYPVSGLGYRLYVSVMPRILALMRWRHWRGRADG